MSQTPLFVGEIRSSVPCHPHRRAWASARHSCNIVAIPCCQFAHKVPRALGEGGRLRPTMCADADARQQSGTPEV